MRFASAYWLPLWAAACAGAGAGQPSSTGGSACDPGQTTACVDPSGCAGTQRCAPDGGSLGPCLCSTGSTGGGGGSGGALGGTAGGSSGGAGTLDAGWQLGSLCSQGWDCLSGLCTAIGGPTDAGQTGFACTVACGSANDCLPGWTCASWDGGPQSICQCQWSPQICNGRDDDCNGVVDDEPAASDACGPPDSGAACVDGVCSE